MPIKVVNVQDLFAVGAGTRTIKALVAGPPGSGKTRTASTWPNPLYADIEGRLLSVRDRDVHRVKIDTVAEMEELKALLDQTAEIRTRMLGVPVNTVVIDTVDELARMLIKERLRAEKIETFRMADWGWFGDQLRGILRGFRNLEDLNVLFNVHVKSTEDSETGRVEKKPDIQGAVGNEIAGYVDEAFLLVARPVTDPKTGQRTIKRYFQTFPDAQHDWVKDHSGTLPMEFPITFDDDYDRLAGFVFGSASAAPKAQVQLSTSASIAEEPTAVPAPAPAKKKAAARKAVEPKPQIPIPVADRPTVDVPLPEEIPRVEPEPEPVPEKETVSEAPVAAEKSAQPECSQCGVVIDNPDVAEVSEIRYGVALCREHFAARRNAK